MAVIRSVESPHHHVWTDALHARDLARRAQNEWDLGTYVRWTINTAWTAFEIACEEALRAKRLGERFKPKLDDAFDKNGLPRPDWGEGLWQRIGEVHTLRRGYVHVTTQERLFAPLSEAEKAIRVLRDGIKDVYRRVGKEVPLWPDEDENPEPPRLGGGAVVGMAHVMITRAGVSEDDPGAIRVAYVVRGEEKVSEICPPGTDWAPIVEQLISSLHVAASAIRVYRGAELIEEIRIRMRGS
jgi:hypothetical protein